MNARVRKMGGELDQYRMTSSPRIPLEEVPRAKALYSYRGQNPGELKFNKGDIITLYRQLDENWYLGEINRVSGVFPTNAVQIIKQLPQLPPLCRALYNFNLKSKNKNEKPDCLSFRKGDIITIISRMDENWAEGKLGDRTGIFPILFVEPNATAQQLLQRSKSYQSSPLKCASPLQRMVHSPTGRQTLDISSPVLISSSNPCVTAKHQEKLEAPYNIPDQVSPSCYVEPESMGHSTAIVSLPHLQQHLSLNMSVALHSYTAHSPEELSLQKGEGVRVLGKYREGWLKGMSLITGKVGIFPSNYVAPFFRKSSSFSDSKMPSLYATWTLSTSSLSSQGSIPGHRPGQSRPLKSLTSPVRNLSLPSASVHTPSLRRGRSSNKKSGSLQKPLQPGALIPLTSSLQRHPPTPARSQQTPIYQSISSLPRGVGTADTGIKLSASHNSSLVLLPRSGNSRAPSVCSSVILDTSEVQKNELAVKPPASAPPSILVKPDTLKNTTEKQVKTVRFQNYSPPPSKRDNSVSSVNLSNGKPEQGMITEAIQPESNIKSPEISALYSHRIVSSSVHQKRMPQHKTSPLDLSSQAGHLTFPTKKNYNSTSEN
ncbi:putative E3 ubiquitin-protein ligase SH3RF2 [Crotalus adamanteus]|uniref:E3 ubiquitin-protein ligase SH3RF2 n=1 Tax=Crotalus adamanteus TaxID=8729 RepID=A0AAW1BW01_CROAD